MKKGVICLMLAASFVFMSVPFCLAADREILGVAFPEETMVNGKTLKLNGVASRKALGFIKVYAGGFYLENPTHDAEAAIMSQQTKHFVLHYLTDKATSEKLREGFIKAIEKANPPEMVQKHQKLIEQYAGWLDQDMRPGDTSVSTYDPGKGLSLWINGILKGTINDMEFAQMYYRYNLGENAERSLREGYLGLD